MYNICYIIVFFFSLILAEPIKINLISTNDLHGVIEKQKAYFINPEYPPTILGGAAFAQYIDDLRNEIKLSNEGLIILDGGNFFQGHPLGMADSGKTIIDWMERIKYDAIVPGIYDFILGSKNLNRLSTLSSFPFLFSNLNCNECPLTSNNIKPFIIKNINGVKIGILGIVNSKLPNLTLNKNIDGVTLKSELNSLEKWIPIMKADGAEVIILLTSSGIPYDREQKYGKLLERINSGEFDKTGSLNALELAHFSDGIDLIVAGGNSKGYNLPWYDPYSHVFAIQGYGNGTEFSHIKIIIDDESHLFMGYETVIDNKVGQTLFSDDFQLNANADRWIIEKTKELSKKNTLNKKSGVPESNDKYIPLNLNKWDIPNFNKPNSLEIITWNCKFFPHSNDSTVLALAESILDINADIIAFQEIKEVGMFSKVMEFLPNYNYITSLNTSFLDLAIIYKTDILTLINQIEPFSENDYNFAGRPPLHAYFNFLENGKEIPLSIINLHMKCCDSGLDRRKKASAMLYDYLSSSNNNLENLIVLGDWNDDTKDQKGDHCFDLFFNDNHYFFPTHTITYDLDQASYPHPPYTSFLDHIMVSRDLIPINTNYTVQTIRMDKYMGGLDVYDAYISDHLPVLFSFSITTY